MDIVQFFEDQVEIWNDANKCELCWSFSAPLTESAINLVQAKPNTDCCVQVLLTRDKVTPFSTTNTYDNITSMRTRTVCNTSFQLLFLMQSDMGANNYDEIKGHDTDGSKWTKILSKLEQCISCDMNIDFCEIIGQQYRVTQWSAKQEINFMDKNYSGYRLTVNFQTSV